MSRRAVFPACVWDWVRCVSWAWSALRRCFDGVTASGVWWVCLHWYGFRQRLGLVDLLGVVPFRSAVCFPARLALWDSVKVCGVSYGLGLVDRSGRGAATLWRCSNLAEGGRQMERREAKISPKKSIKTWYPSPKEKSHQKTKPTWNFRFSRPAIFVILNLKMKKNRCTSRVCVCEAQISDLGSSFRTQTDSG